MSLSLANCKKCKKVFQKRLIDLCPECIVVEEEQFKVLYRALQKSREHGGVAIEELANEVGISVGEIEEFYYSGRLGTAGSYLKFQCTACGLMMTDLQRKGRYCVNCSEKTAAEAGVQVRSSNELERKEAKEQEQLRRMEMLKKAQPSTADNRRFGMSRRS